MKFIWLLIGFLIGSLSLAVVYSAIDFKANSSITFTKKDLLETDLSKSQFQVTVLGSQLNNGVYNLDYQYPTIVAEGKEFKVNNVADSVFYDLKQYSLCRMGDTKEGCIAKAKDFIKNQVERQKNLAKAEAERL